MPTGYTCDVQSGKVTDFRDFALDCARAFGACITMRDEPTGTPIPDQFEVNTEHNDRAIKGAQESIESIRAMSDEDCEKEALTDFQQNVADYKERCKDREDQRMRYKRMLLEVDSWKPPTLDHKELKAFMRKQLVESIDFDCSGSNWDKHPERETGKEWRERERAAAQQSLERNIKHRDEEIKRVNTRNKWVADLRNSLDAADDNRQEPQ